jgi:hypothetical protein
VENLEGQEVRGLSGLVFRVQELIEQGLHAGTRYQSQTDKIMRMHAQTAMTENGFVHLPKEAGWLAYLRRW